MSSLWWLTRKHLLRFFSDKRGAAMTVLLPVILGTLMGALMSPKKGPSDIPILVVQQDKAQAVTDFVTAIDAHDMFTVERVDLAQARARVGSGKSSLALVLPEGSGKALSPTALFTGGDKTEAQLLHDPSRTVQFSIARGLLTQVLMQELGRGLTDPMQMKSLFADAEQSILDARAADPDAVPDELLEFVRRGADFAQTQPNSPAGATGATGSAGASAGAAGGLQPPLSFVAKPLTDNESGANAGQHYSHYAHNYAGMLLIFLLFAGTSSAQSLLREREEGVLQRVQLSHASRGAVVLSIVLGTTAVALLSSLIVYAVGIFAFGIEVRGSALGLVLVLVCQALFVGGFGALLVGLGRSEKQISSLSTMIVLPIALLGGAMLPSFLFPDWLQAAQVFVPTYWATHGLAAMTWRGSGIGEALISGGALLAFAAVFTAVGMRRFRWDGDGG